MGQIVDAATKQPVPGAIVNLTGGGLVQTVLPTGEIISSPTLPTTPAVTPPAPRQVMTDSSGRFLFREIASGRYSVRATAPGYTGSSYGQSAPAGLPQTLELTRDDEKRSGLTVLMWKNAAITGRVTDDIGDPVVGVQVRSMRRMMTGGRLRITTGLSAPTDDRGIYRFSSLPPGGYLIAILTTQTTIPAATADAYMQVMMSGSGTVNSELYRELSSSGAPNAGAGGYRIGDHVLQATPGFAASGAPIPPPSDKGAVLAYPQQYYPSARVAADATVLTVASGEERQGIDLHLKLVPTLRVSGIVTGPDGPVRNLGLRLLPAGAEDQTGIESAGESAATVSDVNGAFTFLGVTQGAYTLKALRVPRAVSTSSPAMTTIEVSGPGGMMMGMSSSMGPGAPAVLPTEPTLSGAMSVNVSDSDVSGLSLVLKTGIRISGKLLFDGAKGPPAPEQMVRASIGISATGETVMQIMTAAKRVEPDGRFSTVGYPPGRYTVTANILPIVAGQVAALSDPTRWRFRSATQGGRDISDTGLEVGADEISDLVITLTDRTQELKGAVRDSRGQPDSLSTVFVFPSDSLTWKQGQVSARRTRAVRTTTLGTYAFPDLAPGAYYLAAVTNVAQDTWQTPKTLEALARIATLVTISDGTTLSQDLTATVIR